MFNNGMWTNGAQGPHRWQHSRGCVCTAATGIGSTAPIPASYLQMRGGEVRKTSTHLPRPTLPTPMVRRETGVLGQ